MLRARRLVTRWHRGAPSQQRVRHQMACVNVVRTSNHHVPRRWISSDEAKARVSNETWTTLVAELDAYRESGHWRDALKLLDHVDKTDDLPALDATMYEHAIAACARVGKVEVLPGLLNNMLVDDLVPTSVSMDFMIQAYLAKEHWGLIVQLANDVTAFTDELSPAAFSAIMEACGQMKDADSTMTIMKQLHESGMSFTIEHYAAAIRALGMAQRPDLARTLLVQMEEQDGLPDNGQAFNQLIRSQMVHGKLAHALQSFAIVAQRGLTLDEPIYTCAIDLLVSKGQHWQATRLFEQMLESGEKHPTVYCLGRAVVAYAGANRYEHARACWHKIVAMKEPNPIPTKYNKILQGLTYCKDLELAMEVFDYVHDLFEPIQIHPNAYTTAIRVQGRLGNTQRAVDLFHECVESRSKVSRFVGIYLALFNALSRDTVRDPALNIRDAKRAWKLMAANVADVRPPAYASLAGVFASTGDLETLQDLIEHAEQRWGATTQVMTTQEHEVDDDGDEVESITVYDHADVDVGMNNESLLFNGIISGLGKARDDQTATIETYLDELMARGLALIDPIVRATTDACVRFENWALMEKLLTRIDVDALKKPDVCASFIVSKLLAAGQWRLGAQWCSFCQQQGLLLPVRAQKDLLRALAHHTSTEWRVAYTLANETLSFRYLDQENVESIADAADVCVHAGRFDLVKKLFDALMGHASFYAYRRQMRQEQDVLDSLASDVRIPLRLYKHMIRALLRKPRDDDDGGDEDENGGRLHARNMNQAEHICRHMLQVHGRRLDGEALSMAISIKATAGDYDDVSALYESMRALGLEPNSYAHNAAITAFAKQHRMDQVLAICEELKANVDERGTLQPVEPNVARNLLMAFARAHDDDALRDAVATLPGCTTEMALNALVHCNRAAAAVEWVPDHVSLDVFESLVSALCDSHDAVLAATLVLKYARLQGVRAVPPKRVMRVTTALVEAEHLVDAKNLLHLFLDGTHGVSLNQMPLYFQQHTIEQLLFIYGESRDFDALRRLFAKPVLAFPLQRAHYEVAMDYCAQSRDELVGAVTSLKLFELMRTHGFVEPSGYTYLLTLQSCLRLERLEPAHARAVQSTGQILLGDISEHGFQKAVGRELLNQVTVALTHVEGKMPKASRRRMKRKETLDHALEHDARIFSPEELARIALFGHRYGLPMTLELADMLLQLHPHLSKPTANELAFVKRSLAEGLGVVVAPGTTPQSNRSRPRKRIVKTRVAPTVQKDGARVLPVQSDSSRRPRSKSFHAALRAATDARWGAILEPIASKTELRD
ncbi:hypothetical protein PsorP6_013481 [Peronosclerospora sorghi]|uniref:Uncharacterized protein n=1 Tax=Peronosclerospora sorghi TaxID=230839 RepID=A0ACC0VHF7_9STRA|nr:hypothetical protein PsorP6_013481 [Peronosclerospora sorghi]